MAILKTMAILAECPVCHKKQAVKNRRPLPPKTERRFYHGCVG